LLSEKIFFRKKILNRGPYKNLPPPLPDHAGSIPEVSCVLDLHSTTQVVSRLHATVLGKSCVV
jgi:hypothetical protein